METLRHTFPFDFVITLGDNIYGGNSASDFLTKFELPYKALLDAGVKFYASLGNHDGTEQSLLQTVQHGRPAVLHVQEGQDAILRVGQQLPESRAAVLAREGIAELNGRLEDPLFPPSALFVRPQTWIDLEVRKVLEPLFLQYGVQVVFSGHDHVYERMKPQKGVSYFVEGAAGQLRKGNLKNGTSLTAIGYDQDLSFILIEIAGNTLSFQTVSRTGRIVDSGLVTRAGPID